MTTGRRRSWRAWSDLKTAFAVLTILPVEGGTPSPGSAAVDAADLRDSVAFFPLVGLVVGLVLVATDLVFGHLSLLARSALELAVAALLTGGLHLDGLADTGDGLFSRADRERALAIMRDSRLGALGALTLLSVLLLKLSLLGSLSGPPRYLGLVVAPMTGRLAIVLAMAAFPPAQPGSGLGRIFARRLGPASLVVSVGLWVLLAGALLAAAALVPGASDAGGSWVVSPAVVAAPLGALALAQGLAALISRKLGGLTGDTYGALNEVTETIVLLSLAVLAGAGR